MKLLYPLIILFAFFVGCDKNSVTPAPEPELFDCTGLTEVELWGQVYDIESTTQLHLDWNSGLTGSIPAEIGCLTNLEDLSFWQTGLSGTIPSTIGNLTNLTNLRFMYSNFTSIPSSIGNLTKLTSINFEGTPFSSLPVELFSLYNLTSLTITSNNFSGAIPDEIENLVNLEKLYIYNNNFTSIPESFCNIISNLKCENSDYLCGFNFHSNNICESFPSCFENYLFEDSNEDGYSDPFEQQDCP